MAKEKAVKPHDLVTVYGTGESFMGAGTEYKVHKVAAEKLIAKGAATEEKQKSYGRAEGSAALSTGISGIRTVHTAPTIEAPKSDKPKSNK